MRERLVRAARKRPCSKIPKRFAICCVAKSKQHFGDLFEPTRRPIDVIVGAGLTAIGAKPSAQTRERQVGKRGAA